ncbi:GNAT family N-acetyltransferase [Agrobacterium sp. SHOUNA12C]|uniref:Acetyltransferase protein n=2 Tax=Rhizobium rhizogenes TaxID=359 RepID=B9JDN3_RHIR8|nr:MULTISPECIES: GNAT family N-acetyltransferase [Rhizobium]ACM26234.1 acetyltransferase protein [Rhizobium rhizogenes K84]KAA6490957.1 GNAT family N-acetyltransferase [Agrobacterium sp. ICMP 7243]MCJ9724793.1 GNAT family N-acetyltransferase [Agrobacterium sp. BETTINA12B]MCJ9756853.1 GNAT family N-acetyltransferase [Agrobacterium sp. SHOUNA12C]OCJ06411.1 acetyltransferase [Agrobacterium sp. 13-626]OCJ25320.1 acetyltransferase [Agrobacterium sp. B131/95]
MIHIRNAREGETEVLTNIGLRSWRKAMGSIGGSEAMLESASEAFSNFTRDVWLTITVVELNGEVAGWAAREALDETISDFWIDPDYLRQGLGSALLARIEEDVLEQGLERVSLQTHADNGEAIGFFKAHGYAIHWLSVVYSPKLDRDVPTIGLSKALVDGSDGTYGSGL